MTAPTCEIAITGVGLVSCLGLDADDAWSAVNERRDAMRPFTLCECALPPDRTGGEAPEPPPATLPGEVRETRLLRHAIDSAMARAGFGRDRAPAPERTAVILGTTLHGVRRAGEYLRTQDRSRLGTFLAAPVVLHAINGLAIRGPVLSNCSACSSGLGSVALAVTLLEAGLADAVIAGGYDPVCEYAVGGFGSLRLLARGALRPFCTGRDGMKLSEAYAALVLERADHARARSARPLGYVRGFGESSDAHHLTQPHPEGVGAARAIAAALERAGLPPTDIGLIAAHATGTPNNDASEFAALRAVFGRGLASAPTIAFKSHLGHSLGAAGAAELILSLHALHHQVVPPTANVAPGNVEFPDLLLNTGGPRPARIKNTLNLSLGFGGANTCVVLTRDPDYTAPPAPGRPAESRRDVFITGVGLVLPGIVGNEALLARLSDDRPVTADTGAVPEDQFAHLVSTRRVRRLSDYVKVTLAAATAACRDAGIHDIPAFMSGSHGILGTMACSTSFCESYYRDIVERGIDAANPMLFAEGVPNAAAAHLSMALGITGSCQSIIGSRTAGLDALGLAWARIASGTWQRAVVSAGEEYHPIVNEQLRACRLHASPPGEPFGAATGAALGAGAAAIILESAESVEVRGARAIATVRRWAATSPAAGLSEDARIAAVTDAWRSIGAPYCALSSANGSWLDAVEAEGIARASDHPTSISTPVGHIAETLSVTPLAGLVALALGKALPRLRSRSPRLPRTLHACFEPESVSEAGILCTDPTGLASAVAISLLHR